MYSNELRLSLKCNHYRRNWKGNLKKSIDFYQCHLVKGVGEETNPGGQPGQVGYPTLKVKTALNRLFTF